MCIRDRNFSDIYGIEAIGLRYFNVFGREQDSDGAYADVIPKFVSSMIRHESPKINGDGSYSRDFTYIDNVIQANQLAAVVPTETIKEGLGKYRKELSDVPEPMPGTTLAEVFNVAYGERASLNDLAKALKEGLAKYDPGIKNVEFQYGPTRAGDVPHSLASIRKGELVLGYQPAYSLKTGLEEACAWYWESSGAATSEG